ncbi:hypothetical protein D3C87_2178160 [compost metagenome]
MIPRGAFAYMPNVKFARVIQKRTCFHRVETLRQKHQDYSERYETQLEFPLIVIGYWQNGVAE